jgi:hypothetical protein
MHYQYLFCASCGLRRFGHGFRCSVCGTLLRRPHAARAVSATSMTTSLPLSHEPVVRTWQDRPAAASPAPERVPVAA